MNSDRSQGRGDVANQYYNEYAREQRARYEMQQYQACLERIKELDADLSDIMQLTVIDIEKSYYLIDKIEQELHEISEFVITVDVDLINSYQEKIRNYKKILSNAVEVKINQLLQQIMKLNHDMDEMLSKNHFFENFNKLDYIVYEMEQLANRIDKLHAELSSHEKINLTHLARCKDIVSSIPNSSSLRVEGCYGLALNAQCEFMLFLEEVVKLLPDYTEKYQNWLAGTAKYIRGSISQLSREFNINSNDCDTHSGSFRSVCELVASAEESNQHRSELGVDSLVPTVGNEKPKEGGDSADTVGGLPNEVWQHVFDYVDTKKDKSTLCHFSLTCTLFNSITRFNKKIVLDAHVKEFLNTAERNYAQKPQVRLLCSLDNMTVHGFTVLPNGNIAVLTYGLTGFFNEFILPFISISSSPNFIIDGQTGKRIRYFGGEHDSFDAIVAMPNSDLVTVIGKRSSPWDLQIWDSETGENKEKFTFSLNISDIYEINELSVIDDETVMLRACTHKGVNYCTAYINIVEGKVVGQDVGKFLRKEDQADHSNRTIYFTDHITCNSEYGRLSFFNRDKCIKEYELSNELGYERMENNNNFNLKKRNDGNIVYSYSISKRDIFDNFCPQAKIYIYQFPKRLENKLDQASDSDRAISSQGRRM